MTVSIGFITSRLAPCFEWFFESLLNQRSAALEQVIVIDYFSQPCDAWTIDDVDNRKASVLSAAKGFSAITQIHPPKPTLWAGPSRITKKSWWHKASCLNTCISLCKTDWLAMIDDRCVLGPNWMKSVKKAMKENYAVCGAYEKRVGMVVTNGKITSPGTVIGRDHRRKIKRPSYVQTFGHDWFGCTCALPLEWALKVNGYPELTDGIGYEDTAFGKLLSNNNFHVHFDPDMMVIQDRTEGQCGPVMRREDVGKSPDDKSHALVKLMDTAKTSGNSYDLRTLRNNVLAGQPFPPPTASTIEWYTGLPIVEFQDRTFP